MNITWYCKNTTFIILFSLFYTMFSIAMYLILCVFLFFMDSKSSLFWYLERIFIILNLLFFCVSSYLFCKSQFVIIDEYDFWYKHRSLFKTSERRMKYEHFAFFWFAISRNIGCLKIRKRIQTSQAWDRISSYVAALCL